MDVISIEVLGFMAGATNLFSSVPQLAANFRNPDLANGQSLSRNCFQFAGNGLWMVYGFVSGSMSMTTFASLGCAMACGLIFQTIRAKKQSSSRMHRVNSTVQKAQLA